MEECITNCIGLESSEMDDFGDEQQDSRENQNALSSKNIVCNNICIIYI